MKDRAVRVEKDGKSFNIRHSENVGPTLRESARLREQFDRHGFGDGYQKVCSIPEPVAVEIMQRMGINVLNMNRSERRAVLNFMRSNYPQFMAIDPKKRW